MHRCSKCNSARQVRFASWEISQSVIVRLCPTRRQNKKECSLWGIYYPFRVASVLSSCCCFCWLSLRTHCQSRPWQQNFSFFFSSTSSAHLPARQYIFILLDIAVTMDLPPYKHSNRMLLWCSVCKSISASHPGQVESLDDNIRE